MESTVRLMLAEPVRRYGTPPPGTPALLAWTRSEATAFVLAPGTSVLGSGSECTHVLRDCFVSRRHARVTVEPGRVRIADLGSTNGTLVNGRRVEAAVLTPGARVTLGRTELLMVERHGEGDDARWEVADWTGAGALGLEALRRVLVAAHLDVPVLVSGPTGTGKEVVASLIHRLGPRPEAPFVAVNCATLEPGTADAELFGHAAGAFTDGKRERPGLFVAAGEGTVFLDEVAEARPEVQAKLLRVLERREVRRLGEDVARPVRCRVVAASLASFDQRLRQGTFREDLFHRLAAFEIRLAPLADRPADVLAVARRTAHHEGFGLTAAAERALLSHPWPGNVRELLHVLTRARIQARGDTVDLPDVVQALGRRRVELVEPGAPGFPELLQAAVVEQGSLRRALASLGVPRSSYYDLKKRARDAAVA
jgi:DNA-binding NtrC family response regulator